MLACVLSRHNLEGIQWMTAHAPRIVGDAGAGILMNAGRSGELRPVNLTDEPDLAALVASVEPE